MTNSRIGHWGITGRLNRGLRGLILSLNFHPTSVIHWRLIQELQVINLILRNWKHLDPGWSPWIVQSGRGITYRAPFYEHKCSCNNCSRLYLIKDVKVGVLIEFLVRVKGKVRFVIVFGPGLKFRIHETILLAQDFDHGAIVEEHILLAKIICGYLLHLVLQLRYRPPSGVLLSSVEVQCR